MNNFNDKVSFIWSIADLIRDTFKRGKYQDVILPFTVLCRIDSVLQPTKLEVHEDYSAGVAVSNFPNEYRTKLDNLDPTLRSAGVAVSNFPRKHH